MPSSTAPATTNHPIRDSFEALLLEADFAFTALGEAFGVSVMVAAPMSIGVVVVVASGSAVVTRGAGLVVRRTWVGDGVGLGVRLGVGFGVGDGVGDGVDVGHTAGRQTVGLGP